jgi:hypothetical protein
MFQLRSLTLIAALALATVPTARAAAAQAKPSPSAQGAKPAPAAKGAKPAPPAPAAPSVDARDLNLRAYVELLRSDVRSQKVAILAEMMGFTEQEDAKFWPIYREYDVELSKINDDRVALIEDYAKNYEQMTDTVADRIARGALGLEERRNALKLQYYERLKSALSAKTAARFLQVENQLLMIIDLQISAALPVVK